MNAFFGLIDSNEEEVIEKNPFEKSNELLIRRVEWCNLFNVEKTLRLKNQANYSDWQEIVRSSVKSAENNPNK